MAWKGPLAFFNVIELGRLSFMVMVVYDIINGLFEVTLVSIVD